MQFAVGATGAISIAAYELAVSRLLRSTVKIGQKYNRPGKPACCI
jgi:hypothetical protein